MREYIHPYERSLERELCLLNEDPAISKVNRELMLGFYRHMVFAAIALFSILGTLILIWASIPK